jgi:branched-chain amino acid transport system permease protein
MRSDVLRYHLADRRLRLGATLAAILAAAVLVGVAPTFATGANLFFWEVVGCWMLFATSVNLLFGYANMPSFGQAAYFGIGAYTVGMTYDKLPVAAVMLLSMLLAGAAAAVIGTVSVRTGGIALANITLAFAQVLYLLTYRSQLVGGENGLPGITAVGLTYTQFWYLLWACVGFGLLVLWRVVHSPFGYVLRAMREDQKRTLFLGLELTAYRITAFVISGVMAGLAGALFAYSNQIVTPDVLYWTNSGNPIIMAIIGGVNHFWGPAVGAVLLTWGNSSLSQATRAWLLYLGVILFFFLTVLPNGLLSLPEQAREHARTLSRWAGRLRSRA